MIDVSNLWEGTLFSLAVVAALVGAIALVAVSLTAALLWVLAVVVVGLVSYFVGTRIIRWGTGQYR